MPDVLSDTKSYLVVDGFINPNGITTIKLSRTYNIQAIVPPAETRATVRIADDAGSFFELKESPQNKGSYVSGPLTLNTARQYRLQITTTAGKEYQSAFVAAKITPRIDAVSWKLNGDGVDILVNSHDDTGKTQYYRWDYEETWEIIPAFQPQVEYIRSDGSIRPIAVPYPTICWGSQNLSAIKQSKTTALTQDVVSDYVLHSLPSNSERLRYKYSILVKQYAQTEEEYEYWSLLKKNTENIGTLFDPLPSQLTGNVTCVNDEQEIALGYIGAHSEEQQRIFISRPELPNEWRIPTGYELCFPPDTIRMNFNSFYGGLGYVPIYFVVSPGGDGYVSSNMDCVDCRKRGSAIKPAFWP